MALMAQVTSSHIQQGEGTDTASSHGEGGKTEVREN